MQSAFPLQPPTSFGDLLKQAKESISSSPADSRRESVAVTERVTEAERKNDGGRREGLEVPPRRKPARPEDLECEKRRVEVRERYVPVHHIPLPM